MSPIEITAHANELKEELRRNRERVLEFRERASRTWVIDKPIDKLDIARARTHKFYFLAEETLFETAFANILSLIYDTFRLLERRIGEYIGIEAETLYDIYYIEGKYVLFHPQTHEEVRRNDNLVVIYTASIETEGGHQPIGVEITAGTIVTKMGRVEITRVENRIHSLVVEQARRYFLALGNMVYKIGIEYVATDEKEFTIAREPEELHVKYVVRPSGGRTFTFVMYPVIRIFFEYAQEGRMTSVLVVEA
jgi:hypothetical protein